MSMIATQTKPWAKMVAPIVAKCKLAAKLDMNATWNPDGATALAEMLEHMALALDDPDAYRAMSEDGQSKDEGQRE